MERVIILTVLSAMAVLAAPAHAVTVVSINANEAGFADDNLSDTTDMQNLARRVDELAPRAPDAVLTQETGEPGARRVAAELSRRFYDVVGVYAIAPVRHDCRGRRDSETRVLVNLRTARLASLGGRLCTPIYYPEARAVIDYPQRSHAHVTLDVRGVRVALLSAHIQAKRELRRERRRSIPLLARRFRRAEPRADLWVFGGDLNDVTCGSRVGPLGQEPPPDAFGLEPEHGCRYRTWWRRLRADGWRDSFWLRGLRLTNRIDYIWARGGRVVSAGVDPRAFGPSNNPLPTDTPDFYSDHPLYWAGVRR